MKVKRSPKEIALGRLDAFLESPESLSEFVDYYCDSIDPLK